MINTKCTELIKNISLFSDLQESECQKLADVLKEREVRREDVILTQNDPGDVMFIIVKGKVKIVLLSPGGKEIILTTLKSGDFFGEMSLVDGEPRSASAIAVEDSSLFLLRRDSFIKVIMNNPEMALKIMKEMSKRIRRADEKIEDLALLDVYGRVARTLLNMAKEGIKTPQGMVIEKRPTQQEMANMIGTSRETVSRILSELGRRGYITTLGRKMIIHGNLSTRNE
jgi:CRP/FNR family cyclic AMP-dependent transcriptional regulator